jgi:hypothetical protein
MTGDGIEKNNLNAGVNFEVVYAPRVPAYRFTCRKHGRQACVDSCRKKNNATETRRKYFFPSVSLRASLANKKIDPPFSHIKPYYKLYE